MLGRAVFGNNYVFGCAGYTGDPITMGVQATPSNASHAGVLTLQYNPITDTIQTRKIAYPVVDNRRIGTFVADADGNIIGLWSNSNLAMPATFLLLKPNSTRFESQYELPMLNPASVTAPYVRPCAWLYEPSHGARLIVFWPTGRIDIMLPTRNWKMERSLNLTDTPLGGTAAACTPLTFTTGYDQFFVADSITSKLYIITASTGTQQEQ
jgi:hypothetical protein